MEISKEVTLTEGSLDSVMLAGARKYGIIPDDKKVFVCLEVKEVQMDYGKSKKVSAKFSWREEKEE